MTIVWDRTQERRVLPIARKPKKRWKNPKAKPDKVAATITAPSNGTFESENLEVAERCRRNEDAHDVGDVVGPQAVGSEGAGDDEAVAGGGVDPEEVQGDHTQQRLRDLE